jgi:hypothetical protein
MKISSMTSGRFFNVEIQGFDTLQLRPMTLEEDLHDIYRWVQEKSARFWGQAGKSLDELREQYAGLLRHSPSGVLIGLLKSTGEKICMLLPYAARDDEIGPHVQADDTTWGCHMFMVPTRAPIGNLTYFAFIALQHHMFMRVGATRLVHQPDIHNVKVAARLVQSGYRQGRVAHLREKSVRIFTMTADEFKQRSYAGQPGKVEPPSPPLAIKFHSIAGRLGRKVGLYP